MRQNQFMKRISAIILILTGLLLLCGCATFDPESLMASVEKTQELQNTQKELITVGFSQLGSESVWREANSASVKNALTQENGFDLEFRNARQKQENQIKDIRSFISMGVDYIAFSPVTEAGWETVLGEARAAGIPVILADRKISTNDDSLYTCWVGSDARKEGENAGSWLEGCLKKQGREFKDIKIVVLQGTIGSSAQLGRTMGFDSVAEKHSNWHILEQQSADFTTAKAKEVMKTFIEKYPEIDVIVSQNDDMTFGVIEALDEAGLTRDKNTIVISFDAVKKGLEYVQQGIINVEIECNPNEGAYIADIIKKLERGEKVEKNYMVDEMVFTAENVAEYIGERSY